MEVIQEGEQLIEVPPRVGTHSHHLQGAGEDELSSLEAKGIDMTVQKRFARPLV